MKPLHIGGYARWFVVSQQLGAEAQNWFDRRELLADAGLNPLFHLSHQIFSLDAELQV